MICASVARIERSVRIPVSLPVRAPAILQLYRLERTTGPAMNLSPANDKDAIQKAFQLLNIQMEKTPQRFLSHGGKRLVRLGPVEQQVYPPQSQVKSRH